MLKKKRPHIIIAPNSFKGSLSGKQAADCIAKGIRRSSVSIRLTWFPVADGGSDTMQLLVDTLGAQTITLTTSNPYGQKIESKYGWLASEKTAFIGLSEASGIQFKTSFSDVLCANTYGTGEQISDAINKEAKKIIIGVGGSATTDGGAGLLRALGLKLEDGKKNEVSFLPKDLPEIRFIKTDTLRSKIAGCEVIVLCDVENPLLGNEGTAHVFAPQKGASGEQIIRLEKCMYAWNEITKKYTGIDMSVIKHGGAAGGTAAGLRAWCSAKLISGIDFFMDEFNLNNLLMTADYLITGEGKIDLQTIKGKAPFGLAKRCKEFRVPVVAFCGETDNTVQSCFDKIISINKSRDLTIEMKHTALNLEDAALQWANTTFIQ